MKLNRFMTRDSVERDNGVTRLDAGVARVLDSFELFVDPTDRSVGQCLLNDGFWESWITAWMTSVIQPHWNCLDIGANFGYYTGVMATLAQEGKTVAIEANPEISSRLIKSVDRNQWNNVTVEACGVGATSGNLSLMMNSDLQGSGSFLHNEEYFKGWGDNIVAYDVPVFTLDHIAESKPLKWDFIKMDVEGFEPHVFAGGSAVMSDNPLIAIEVTNTHPEEFLDMLFAEYHVTAIGFSGYEEPVERNEILTRDWWMLALRKREK